MAFAVNFTVYGQRQKNNIYLFDCTGSMKTAGLWQPAQDALDATISTQAKIPESDFTIIPFGNDPYELISFSGSQYNSKKKEIASAFEKYIAQAKYTHVSDVLKAGFQKIDPNKENKIYLLTDGMPNGGDSADKVAQTISQWCGNHKNCRLFYVALTNGVINPTIQKAIDDCKDAFVVQCQDKVIPQIADLSSDVYTNIEELKKDRQISFSIPGDYALSVTSSDPVFDVKIKDSKATNCQINVSLESKGNKSAEELHQILGGEDYEFLAEIRSTDKKYFVANPIVRIHVADQMPIELVIGAGKDELKSDGANWHDSFLWSKSANDEYVEWDLAPAFRNDLKNSALKLKFESDGDADYEAWFNGNPIGKGDIIAITPDSPAVIKLHFNHDAKTGKRYFYLSKADTSDIDMINEMPSDEYEGLSLRTSYSIGWNPLKTILFWLAIIILAFILLWFIVLKRIFYPTIKVSSIEITGPGSYYVKKKLKGARMVVMTSKKKSQGFFSKLTTGEIRYIKADHFDPEITITPAGSKKKIRIRSEKNDSGYWDIIPSTLGSYEKGMLTHFPDNQKAEIETN